MVRPGDFVKASFDTGDGNRERLWVHVTSVGDADVAGELNNCPVGPDLALGDRVSVPLVDVIDYLPAQGAA